MTPNSSHHRSDIKPPSSASSPPPSLIQFYRRHKRQTSGGSSTADPIPTPTPSQTPEDPDPSFQKKTRDLPNLTECQACGFRIDVCDGKHRLQALYSEWRIVLLCKKCLFLVESSRICSYCFANSSTDCFRCRECARSVHEICFNEYRSIAPWSYSCTGSEFSVCVDCWVPKSLISSRRVSKSRRIGEKLESFRDSDYESEGDLEDVATDAKCNVEKKVRVAKRDRDRERPMPQIVVGLAARRAVGLASNSMDLVAKRGGNGGAKVVDDAQLAIKLHRAMNSSPRIAKNSCSVNFRRLDVPRMLKYNGDSSARGSDDSGNPSVCGKLEARTNNKLYDNPDKSVSEPSVCARALDGVVGMTNNAREDDPCPEKCNTEDKNGNVDVPLKEGEGSCSNKLMNSFGDDNSMDSESLPDRKQDRSTAANATNCNKMPDRYRIKYVKRRPNLKTPAGWESKFLSEGLLHESQPSAAGVLLNSSKETKTLSNSSLQSCAVPSPTS